MRLFSLITLCLALPLCADEPSPAVREIKTAPLLQKVAQSFQVQTSSAEKSAALMQVLGLDSIQGATHQSTQVDDTHISTFSINRESRGIFQILNRTDTPHFSSTETTDIAFTCSFHSAKIPPLLRQYHAALGNPKAAEDILNTTIGDTTVEALLKTSPRVLQVCIDFEANKKLFLGKESIDYPHIALRFIGGSHQFESILTHYMKTRNALFTKSIGMAGEAYSVPEYFSDAIAGYLPVIQFDHASDTTTIASSHQMLWRLLNEHDSLFLNPDFRDTWDDIPSESQLKIYLSKNALQDFHKFYLLSLREKWTNNPTFLKNKFAISAGVAQLNSSESGLALSLSSEEKADTLTIKSPFASNFLVWLLGL